MARIYKKHARARIVSGYRYYSLCYTTSSADLIVDDAKEVTCKLCLKIQNAGPGYKYKTHYLSDSGVTPCGAWSSLKTADRDLVDCKRCRKRGMFLWDDLDD